MSYYTNMTFKPEKAEEWRVKLPQKETVEE